MRERSPLTERAPRDAMPGATDWRVSVIVPFAFAVVGLYAMCMIAVEIAAAEGNAEQWPHIIAQWGASSSGHVSWSAPLLVTSVGALAALSNSPISRDPVLGMVLTFAAQSIGVGATLWSFSALMAVVVTADEIDPSGVSQLWGVVFVGAPVVVVSLFAGRFPRITPEDQLSAARTTLARLDRELREMLPRARSGVALTRARWAAWRPVIVAGIVTTCGLIAVEFYEEFWDLKYARVVLLTFWTIWATSAASVCALRIIWNQPRGWLWRLDCPAHRRTPTRLCVGMCVALSAFAVGPAVSLTVAIVTASESEIRWAYAAACVGGSAALTVAVLWRERGTNSWATISYLKTVRVRNQYMQRLQDAQAMIVQRQQDERAERRWLLQRRLLGWIGI